MDTPPEEPETYSTARRQLRALEDLQDQLYLWKKHELKTKHYSPQVAKEERELTKALTALLAEMRKMDDAMRKDVAQMTPQDRLDALLDLVELIPSWMHGELASKITLLLSAATAPPADIVPQE